MSSWRTLRPLGIADRDVVDLRLEAGVELLGHVRVLAERLHLRPERLLLLGDRRVVLLQLGAAFAQAPTMPSMWLCDFWYLAKYARTRSPKGTTPRSLRGTALGQIVLRRVQLLDRAAQLEEALGDRCVTLAETAHRAGRPVEQPVAHVRRRADLAVGEAVDIVDTSAVVVAVDVDRPGGRRRTSSPWRRSVWRPPGRWSPRARPLPGRPSWPPRAPRGRASG